MDIIAQIIAKISDVSSILIMANGSNGDSVAASLALHNFLKKLDKSTQILSPAAVAEKFKFLPQSDAIAQSIDLTKSFVIDVSTKKTQVAELSYKKETERLSIFLRPTGVEFAAADVSFRTSNFPFDLVILVGVSSLEQLGEFHSQHPDLFFDVPVVNIDFRASNENYGQFNLVQLPATSCSEIVLDLISKFEASLIDETIATQLLAGIIAESNSFQHVRTTPQTFLKASQLVGLGANQQEIISNLYKSKTLGLLKLWGRVLARLQQDASIGLVYSAVNQNDLEKSQAVEADSESIIKEMASQLGFAKIFLFVKEEAADKVTAFVHTTLPINLAAIFSSFAPKGIAHQTVKFTVNQNVAAAERLLVDLLREEIGKLKPVM